MKLDFHVHGLLSKKSDFNEELFLKGIEYAKEQGLNGFVLCEHFNAKDIKSIYKYLEDNYKYVGDKYIVNDFSVFLGMEVDIKNGGHVIVSGNREDILNLRCFLNDYRIKPNFIEFEKLIEFSEKHNCLIIGSHPYRDSHKLYLQPKDFLKRLDALDLNATDIFTKGLECTREKVEGLSNELDIPYVTGSDSHYPMQLGSVSTEFNKEYTRVSEIKNAIKNKEYKINISKAIDIKVFSAKVSKAYIKGKMICEINV